MLFTLAWRNIWRNKKRSAIILGAIAFGIWAAVFGTGFYFGMMTQMVESGISTRVTHIQIHDSEFRSRRDIELLIPSSDSVLAVVRQTDGVSTAVGRAVVSGMVSTAAAAGGVDALGVNTEQESSVTDLPDKLVEGTWFGGNVPRNPIVIGQDLAEKLEIGLGNKLVIQAQSVSGEISAGAFRVVGIFKTSSSQFDETTVFTRYSDLNRIFELGGNYHEIVLRIKEDADLNTVHTRLAEKLPAFEVATWKTIAPELAFTIEMGGQQMYIFVIIILLALIFGITNTMLMSVLERVREFGVLIATGMKGRRLFAMIVLETLMLGIVGSIVGLALGAATNIVTAHTGIDLSAVSEGLEAFGMSSLVRPQMPVSDYFTIALMVFVTALVSSLYPGIKAVRLNPVEAIRTYG